MARSQAARTRCARRLRAKTKNSRRGGGSIRPPFVSPDLPAPAQAGDPGPRFLRVHAKTRRWQRAPPPAPRHCEARKGRGNPWTEVAVWGEDRPWIATLSARNDEKGEPPPTASNPALPVAKASARRAASTLPRRRPGAWSRAQPRTRRSSAGPQKVSRGDGLNLMILSSVEWHTRLCTFLGIV